jgi:iron complex transport system ATP-binding protein
VVWMREGRIVGDGRKEEMLSAECLGEVFGIEVQVANRDGFYHLW